MTEKEKKEKRYNVALATRSFEIELFWKRSLFFGGFIASSFIGYATLIKYSLNLAIIIACFGFICSIAWTFVNRGSKRWHENWEYIVGEFEKEITGDLFSLRMEKNKKGWLSARKFSVSKLTIALSDFTAILWFFLLLYHFIKLLPISMMDMPSYCLPMLAIISSFIFAYLMLYFGKSND